MKRTLSLFTLLLMAVISFAEVTINTSKYYKIECTQAKAGQGAYVTDDGSANLKVVSANDERSAYWQFEASSTAGCYYIKSVQTGKYAQAVGDQGTLIATGTTAVDYVVVDCSTTEADGFVGITSNDRDPKDFTATTTLGWNWNSGVNPNVVQSYQGKAGQNHKTFWILHEYDEAPAAKEEAKLSSIYTGIAPSEIVAGQDYYLYNVETGLWLQNNDRTTNDWHTRGQLGTRGLDFQINAADGGYYLNAKFGKTSLSATNLYLDTTTESVWTFTTESTDVSNTVTITSGDCVLGARNYTRTYVASNIFCEDPESNYYLENQASEGTKNNHWQIVTKEERLAKMLELGKTKAQDASWLVKSPDFANNDTRFSAWKKVGAWNRGGDASGDWGRGNMLMESWNTAATAHMYQVVEVPAGRYSLQLQGFYRDGKVENIGATYEAGNEEIRAYYYANDVKKNLTSIIDGHTSKVGSPDRWTTQTGSYYVPNSMADCARCININKAYVNDAIEVTVPTGELQIGVRKTGAVEGDWVIFDNTKLMYLGPITDPVVYFTAVEQTYIKGDQNLLEAKTMNVADGTAITWTSSNPEVATVDENGIVTSVGVGTTTITATAGTASGSYTVTVVDYTRRDADGVGYLAWEGGAGYSTGETYSKMCDGDASTKYCGTTANAWIAMVAEEPVAVKQYSIVTGADTNNYYERNPKSWKLEGSNDYSTWTVIDTQNEPYLMRAIGKEEYVFNVNGTDKYKFFKFTATAGRSGCVQLAEVWINAQAQTFGEPVVTAATCKASGTSVITSDLGVTRTTILPETANHTYVNGVCTVCGQQTTTLLADGQDAAYTVKYKWAAKGDGWAADPEGWTAINFDDSAWDNLNMPIGSSGYGAKYNTVWYDEYNNFWMRRTFYVDDPTTISNVVLKTLHDDCYKVYLNGTLVTEDMADNNAWTEGTNWLSTNVDNSLLQAGKNVIAVYIQQNWGGAYCDFQLLCDKAISVTVPTEGFCTYVAPGNIAALPEGLEADAVQLKNEGLAHLEPVTAIPAGAAVVLKNAGTYNVTLTAASVELGAENALVAATADVTADGTQFVLASGAQGTGFYKATPATTIAAGKGYLVISGDTKEFIGLDSDHATAIQGIDATSADAPMYNLSGQRISKAQKGIYIKNGKKTLK